MFPIILTIAAASMFVAAAITVAVVIAGACKPNAYSRALAEDREVAWLEQIPTLDWDPEALSS